MKEDGKMGKLISLRKAIKKKADPFNEGDVIRWESKASNGFRYRYAVIRANQQWWITGLARFYGAQVFSYEELVEILSRDDVVNVAYSSRWESIKSEEDN